LVWTKRTNFFCQLAGILVLNGWTRTSATSTFLIVSEFKWSPVTSACEWARARQWRMEDMSGLCTHTHRPYLFLPARLS